MSRRTHYAGEITEDLVNQTVVVKGWVDRRRDLGGLIFIDLRDTAGIVQIVVNPEDVTPEVLNIAEKVRSEYVLEISGIVHERKDKNPQMKTGAIEIAATNMEILAEAKTPPFEITAEVSASEDLRLKYRYLDLRRAKMQQNLKIRSKITAATHEYLDKNGFLDLETPILSKSTPEGARDYLVPSRIHAGEFYALPQSPQLFKQLLMGAGFDRYYQIARAFRDEDLRGDRQPEFTQIDLETSFLDQEEIRSIVGGLMQHIMKCALDIDVNPDTFPILTFQESMDRFGTDKPDLRFGMEICDLSALFVNSEFGVFKNALENGGKVKGLAVPNAAEHYSRKTLDQFTKYIERFKARGLAWVKITEGGFSGPVAKFLNAQKTAITEKMHANVGDLLLFVADKPKVVAASLDYLRRTTAEELNLIPEQTYAFAWIVDWPLFEYNEEEDRFDAAHHPFTMPVEKDLGKLADPKEVYTAHAQAYDLVLNGYELGSGSIRINRLDIQREMLKALGFTQDAAKEAFGFLLEAMEYGFPPMGGMGLGLDRLAMILAGQKTIREVIAFPKNNHAVDPLTGSPSMVDEKQLDELAINFKKSIS